MKKKYLIIIFLILSLNLTQKLFGKENPQLFLKEILGAIEKENYTNAIDKLLIFKDRFSHTPWAGRSLYLLGYCYLQTRDLDNALMFYRESKKRYPQLNDYIQFNISTIWGEKGEYKKKIDSLKIFLKSYPSSRLRPNALYQLAQTHFLLNDYKDASKYYQEFIEKNSYEEEMEFIQALYNLGVSFFKIDNFKKAFSTYQRLYIDFPQAPLADLSLQRMEEIKDRLKYPEPLFLPSQQYRRAENLIEAKYYQKAIDELKVLIKQGGDIGEDSFFLLGITFSKMEEKDKAIKILENFIKKYPKSTKVPRAYYRIGRIYWNKGSIPQSEKYLKKLIKKYPKNEWTEKGLYVLARIAEEEGKYKKSLKLYTRLRTDFPKGELAKEAQWEKGWIYYLLKKYKNAYDHFNLIKKDFSFNPEIACKALYWKGRSAERLNDIDQVISIYKDLLQEYPYTYYAYAGKERLEKILKKQISSPVGPLFKKTVAINSKQLIKSPPLKKWESYHYKKMSELVALGFFKDASKEVDILSEIFPREPRYLFLLSDVYYKSKSYIQAIKKLNDIYISLSKEEIKSLPKRFWRIYYPKTPWPIIKLHSENNGLEPYLILAMIRQESAFDPKIISRAGAMGLMQLMPSTAKMISRKLRVKKFNKDMLFMPDINISLGTRYFGDLLKEFDGNLVLALASYNAGEKRVRKWFKEKYRKDIEVFIEQIPYFETKNYVKSILRNYNNYKMIYKNEG